MRLWYEDEAKTWDEALPIGNGRLGAMIYGGKTEEILSLNEDTLWSGEPKDKLNYNAYKYLEEIRTLIFDGKIKEAQALLEKHYFGDWSDSYLPLGDLRIKMKHDSHVTDYIRELTFDNAISTVTYKVGDVKYYREMFASYVDDIIAIKLSSDKESNISCELSLSSPLIHISRSLKDGIHMEGQAPYLVEPEYTGFVENSHPYAEGKGMRFGAKFKIVTDSGFIDSYGSSIRVEKANSVIIYFAAATSFNGYDTNPYSDGKDYNKICNDILSNVCKKDYNDIKAAHIDDFNSLYARVSFSLNSDTDNLPIDTRLSALKSCADSDFENIDLSLVELMFQYGRYLLISSSRPGTQPANLQGIWNRETRPPWSCNYTTNINIEMNYWHAEVCNLGDCHTPLFDAIKELSIAGEKTAKVLYNCNGFTVHHNVDLWRHTTPVSGNCKHAIWPMAGGWMCRHLWEHYLHTLDIDFLRETAYPIMKKSAEFFVDFLCENKDGLLVTNPSTSPENYFLLNGERLSVSTSSTMDTAIIKELFNATITSCDILNVDLEFSQKLKDIQKRLPKYKIGKHGQLQEWDNDYDEFELGHRHMSHLYGLYPGCDITEGDILEVAIKSLYRRIESSSEFIGWNCAWLINIFARLKDSRQAMKYVATLLKHSTYINLLDAYPPFQIDGNFGFTSGIAEMLLQSHKGYIEILPALPSLWKNGNIKGLVARGAFEIDIEWSDSKCSKIVVRSKNGGVCNLKYNNSQIKFDTEKDNTYTLTPLDNETFSLVNQ